MLCSANAIQRACRLRQSAVVFREKYINLCPQPDWGSTGCIRHPTGRPGCMQVMSLHLGRQLICVSFVFVGGTTSDHGATPQPLRASCHATPSNRMLWYRDAMPIVGSLPRKHMALVICEYFQDLGNGEMARSLCSAYRCVEHGVEAASHL